MPSFRQRKTYRLQNYDYGSGGAYFVTVCTHDRQCLLGSCSDGVVELSELGHVIEREWKRSGEIRREVDLDEHIVMPNHLHGIVWIQPSKARTSAAYGRSLGSLMSGFKSACTKIYRTAAGPDAILWQRRFFDHVIRNEKSLRKIREYIQNNPLQWHEVSRIPRLVATSWKKQVRSNFETITGLPV